MLFLVAACVENAVVKVDEPGTFDSGTTPTLTDPDTSTTEPTTPAASPPQVTITAPEGPVPACQPARLEGLVGDDDPLDALAVQWLRDGLPHAYATPDDEGRVALEIDAEAASWELRAVDSDGLTGSDTLDLVVEGFDPGSWDLAPAWERSAMGDRVVGTGIGTCLAAALALPTSAEAVWDDGLYTPSGSSADGTAAGRSWASWDQSGTDCHLFRLTVQLPECPFASLVAQSPWYPGVPINDNLYVYIDGFEVLRGGTSYGVGYGGPAEVDTYLLEGIEIPSALLDPGVPNEILLVAEEYASWGGLGYLDVALVP